MYIPYFAGTAFFIALLDRRDGLHARSIAWINHVQEPIATTEYVLCETLNSFSQSRLRQAAAAFMSSLRSDKHLFRVFAVDSKLFNRGCDLYRDRLDKEWSLTDCISFVLMQETNIRQALTHDHHFEQAGFRALLRENPPSV